MKILNIDSLFIFWLKKYGICSDEVFLTLFNLSNSPCQLFSLYNFNKLCNVMSQGRGIKIKV